MSDEKLPENKDNKIVISDLPTSLPNDVIAGILDLMKSKQDKIVKLAFDQDPIRGNLDFSNLFMHRTNLVPPYLLKRIRDSEELIGGAILPVRARQVAMFGRPRPSRFDVGFAIYLKPSISARLSPEDQEKLKKEELPKLRDMLLTCGKETGIKDKEKRTFAQTLMEITEDILTFGCFCIEIRKDEAGDFHSFRGIDAGSIYFTVPQPNAGKEIERLREAAAKLLSQVQGHNIDIPKFQNNEYSYVQVIEDTPRQAFTDDELLYWQGSPSTDINRSGYPVSPIERIIAAITTHINLTTFNKMYFLNGRAARNVLIFQAENLEENDIIQIKNQMVAHINSSNAAFRMPVFGIGPSDKINILPLESANSRDMEFQYLADLNKRMIFAAYQMSPDEIASLAYLSKGTNSQSLSECLDLSTKILVPSGMKTINQILDGKDSVNSMVWNGLKWVESKIFKSGKKELREVILDNKLSIKTSPDHKFLVIGESGEPEWKIQSKLKIGDYVLVNKKSVETKEKLPVYKGKEITVEMMEVLGWMTGDGCLVSPRKRSGAQLHLFYHHFKEQDILERHYNFLENFGLSPKKYKTILSEEEKEKIKLTKGFESVAPFRIKNILYDTEFINWLFSIGFKSSKDGKVIPEFLFTAPEEYKIAFLKGLFSADGNVASATNGTIILACSYKYLREQVRHLLITMGISTTFHEGTMKQVLDGPERTWKRAEYVLSIKDKRLFNSKIQLLQSHKQLTKKSLEGYDPERIPLSTQIKYCKLLVNSDLKRLYKKNIYRFINLRHNSRMNSGHLLNLLNKANIPSPEWMKEYKCAEIVEIIDHNKIVEMADVTVYEDSHSFFADGFIVHNSSNEYKLEASRDSGLRPLLLSIEDFLNLRLLPRINPEWAKYFQISIEGLDSDSPQLESTKLSQDQALYLSMNDIMTKVEKKPVPIGGDFPLNPGYLQVLEKYFTKGQILKAFGGKEYENADQDPDLQFYMADPVWLTLYQTEQQQQMQQQQMEQQQQMQAQQEGQGQPQEEDLAQGQDLGDAMGQLKTLLSKSEGVTAPQKRSLMQKLNHAKRLALSAYKKDSKESLDKVLAMLKKSEDGHDHGDE